jgi:hypothetical protein
MSSLVLPILLFSSSAFGIPWPLGASSSEQDQTHTLMTVFGDYHIPWSHCCPDSFNFHFGIDFDFPLPPSDGETESENVWAVEDCILTYVQEIPHYLINGESITEWVIVACEGLSSESGWCYQHVEPISEQTPFEENVTEFAINDQIGTMAELQLIPGTHYKHLHFMRSLDDYESEDPGLLNPLEYLSPSPTGMDWDFIQQTSPTRFFFLPDVPAVDPAEPMTGGWLDEWETPQEALDARFTDQYDEDGYPDVHGDIDAFGYVYGYNQGQAGGSPQFSVMPSRISWELSELGVSVDDSVPGRDVVFTDYLYDFGDFLWTGRNTSSSISVINPMNCLV